ncbi:MAG TPA: hypothetical protein VHP14_18770, partial [Anaerolineales bacterium]|nr:hypothetical protein [Anaerolineales bacterium]
MNTISHQQAREWIQIRLDGQLDEAKFFALNIHLQDCAACRLYAADSERLDSELRQAYREHTQMQRSVLSQRLSTGSAVHTMNKQMRLKMKSKQIMNVAASLALVAVMAVVVLGFAWIVSTRGGMIIPGAGHNPLPTPTSTPFPWTESNPLTSTEQIASILNHLADKNVGVFQAAAWVHIVRTDQAQPGMVHSTYSESWTHYSKDNQTCAESLTLVKEGPEASSELQILVGQSDGTSGDLIQLRSGEAQVTHIEPGFDGCSLASEFTPAGQLAARLEKERGDSPQKTVDVKAWYTEQDGRTVFDVSVTFTQPSKANYAGILKEMHSFDLETGMVLQENIRMEWEDGSLFGESLQGYKTEFFSELPADVADRFQQFSDELHAYANGTIVRPTPTQVSESSPGFVVYDQQFIPETNPITDGGTILQILQDLKRLQIERLSKPGWYVYGPASPDPQDWMSNYYLLTHTLDQSGACEFMNYYIKDGHILPEQLVLADGRWGQISVAAEGFEEGEVIFGQ